MGRPWTEAEDDVIRAHWPGVDALPAEDVLAMLPGRNRNQLDHRARKLGIQRHPAFIAAQISAANAGMPKDNDAPIRAGKWPPDAGRFADMRFKPRMHRDYDMAALASLEWWQIRALDGLGVEQATRQAQTGGSGLAAA